MLLMIQKSYLRLVLSTKPSKLWIKVRFLLHWLTLFPKLMIIGSLGTFQIIKSTLLPKKRKLLKSKDLSLDIKQLYFQSVFDRLPIFKTEFQEFYANRVPFFEVPNGQNHNTDHQCSRHSTYAFLMNELNLNDGVGIERALWMLIQPPFLCRGYKYNSYNEIIYNISSTSGDMLCGLSLQFMNRKHESAAVDHAFEQLVHDIIENDYALLEGSAPFQNETAHYEVFQEYLAKSYGNINKIQMKSIRGMWQPGIEIVGAWALTLLAAVRIVDKKMGSREANRIYRRLLWKYGYGLLSLFPTAFIASKRGYFNDHNCMITLYILSSLADTKWGKLFWKIPMVYTWLLSKNWYNGYFTGLLNRCYPGFVSKKYIAQCQEYLYEKWPRTWGQTDPKFVITKEVPAEFNKLAEDEFSPDIPANQIYDNNDYTCPRIRTGLGFIASAILLEEDPQKLLIRNTKI